LFPLSDFIQGLFYFSFYLISIHFDIFQDFGFVFFHSSASSSWSASRPKSSGLN